MGSYGIGWLVGLEVEKKLVTKQPLGHPKWWLSKGNVVPQNGRKYVGFRNSFAQMEILKKFNWRCFLDIWDGKKETGES